MKQLVRCFHEGVPELTQFIGRARLLMHVESSLLDKRSVLFTEDKEKSFLIKVQEDI